MRVLWPVALALVMATGVKAADNEIARSSLKGVKAVKVVIEVSPIASQNGLTEASIRTDVELKLRLADIGYWITRMNIAIRQVGHFWTFTLPRFSMIKA